MCGKVGVDGRHNIIHQDMDRPAFSIKVCLNLLPAADCFLPTAYCSLISVVY